MRLIYLFTLSIFLGVFCTACNNQPSPIQNSETGSVSEEGTSPNGGDTVKDIAYEVVENHPDGSVTVKFSKVRYIAETRERTVKETRTMTETRTRTVTGEDGKSSEQEYTVDVPYTVEVPVTETVQIPVTEARQVVVPAGTDIQDYLKRLE